LTFWPFREDFQREFRNKNKKSFGKFMKSKFAITLASVGFLLGHFAPSAKANIGFNVADIGSGNTRWSLVSSPTTFTVGPFSATGNYDEVVFMPMAAFTFDYSQDFTYIFTSSIGRITDLTSGQSVALDRIFFSQHLGELRLEGGLMNHSLGDVFQITDFSTSDIGIHFSDLVGTVLNNGYVYAAGGWHNDNAIAINPVAIPEPSPPLLFCSGIMALIIARKPKLSKI
jgi:hypothetical protein